MARDQVLIELTDSAWTELSSANATKATFSVVSDEKPDDGIFIRTTPTASAPTEALGYLYYTDHTNPHSVVFADLNPSGTQTRVWGKAKGDPSVYIIYSDDSA